MWEMTPAVNLKSNCNVDYPGMRVLPIRICSLFCILCGIASISTQTAALAIFLETFDRHYVNFPSDFVGPGIWGGSFDVIAGCLGIAVTYARKKTLLVATVVMAAVSIFASFSTSLLSAGAASLGVYSSCYRKFGYSNSICDTWLELQWALMSCGILALISSIVLVILTSGSLCTCCRKHNSIVDMATSSGDYPNMKVKHIRIFAAICIASGIVSILLQFVAILMVIANNEYSNNFPSDNIGCGIWAGVLYLIAGSLGVAVTKTKKKRLLVAVVVISSLSIFASIVTFILSSGVAIFGGNAWLGLEWTIVTCSILALISSIALLILASGSLCTCCRKHEMVRHHSITLIQNMFNFPVIEKPQIAAITIFLAKFGYYYITFTSDVVGYGIWGGALNLIAGCLGIALTYVNDKSL
ncbi:hypothetical protein OUZ56_023182 [Daphnia magna]|nr:hypothetical protein OUZ56_023182 [Daphnia magna]